MRYRTGRVLGRPARTGPIGPRRVSDEFDATPLYGPKEVRRADRFTQFAAVAAEEALPDAGGLDGLAPARPDRIGVIIGTGVGGLETLETQIAGSGTRGHAGSARSSYP